MIRQKHQKKIFLGILILIPLLLLTMASVGIYNSGKNLYSQIQLFNAILDKINNDYVEEKDPIELIDNAIKGMVSNLDPHTTYLTAENFKQWNQNFEGYSGIGVTFDIIRNKITLMAIITDGPSQKMGLLPGDRIIAIDGKSAIGMKRDEVPLLLMGPKGTKVEVTIERAGWDEPKNFVITRDEVHLESIPYAFMVTPDVGYIAIVRFSSTTQDELEENIQKLNAQGMKQLILDLRDNGGGYLDAAVQVVDKFLQGGKRIVYTKGRVQGTFREYFTTDKNTHPHLPLLVLINRISASASEIVAGSLQDWDRALILGETSFGKGLVQSQYRFQDGSALLMTTAKYYTPSGRLIQRPYDDKSFDDYFTEIINDSVRSQWENDASRPSFRTLILQRRVYGGGGITPDAFLKSERDTLSALVLKIFNHPQRFFFTFVEDYVKDHPEINGNFNDFLKNYKPNGNMLQQFLGYIREMGFKVTNQEFVQNKKDIQFLLKRSLAENIWGPEARYKIELLRDYQFIESLNYISQSEELLTKAYGMRGKR